MSDQSAPAEGQSAEEAPATQQQEGPPEWLAPIQQRMDELGESSRQMADQIAGLYQPPQAEEDYDEFEPDGFYDEDGEITEEGAKHIIGREVDERLQAVLSKRDAARALEQREDAFEALRDEIPALADDKLAARLVRDVAHDLEASGQGAIIDTPLFVDLIEQRYKAELYDERAASEHGAEQEREVVLESASGSAPARKKADEVDWGERIVNAAQSLRPQI